MPARPQRAAPRAILLAVVLELAGCRGAAPELPVDGHRELCCKAANPDNLSFVGCRATGYCRASESVWVRGPVSCTAATEEGCAGGRCCELAVEALAVRDDDSSAAASEQDGDDRARVPVAEPVPITPVPLDWQARPTPIAVPKFVCPATIERGVHGTVELRVSVDADGRVREVSVEHGLDPECDALARDALLHAEFEPARAPDGEPIPASLSWSYSFDPEPSAKGDH